MGLAADAKLLLPIVLLVVSIGLVQENLKTVFPIIDGGLGLFIGILGISIAIYFGFIRGAIS